MRLIKLSAPGWIKEFDTEEDCRVELNKHICSMCVEEYSVTESSTLDDLLWTSCGCEYTVEDGEDE